MGYILAFRFIFGLRIASPIALGVSQVPTWRFTLLNIAGAEVWATSLHLRRASSSARRCTICWATATTPGAGP